jgi:hypothetical protein
MESPVAEPEKKAVSDEKVKRHGGRASRGLVV